MSDWIHELPLGWMALLVSGGTALGTAAIYWTVIRSATEDRARAFKAVSPGLLSPLGILFGLLVAFTAAQVWGDIDRANAAVNHEASALRAIVLLSRAFPADVQARMRALVKQYIHAAAASARRRVVRTSIIPAILGDRREGADRRGDERDASPRPAPSRMPEMAINATSLPP